MGLLIEHNLLSNTTTYPPEIATQNLFEPNSKFHSPQKNYLKVKYNLKLYSTLGWDGINYRVLVSPPLKSLFKGPLPSLLGQIGILIGIAKYVPQMVLVEEADNSNEV